MMPGMCFIPMMMGPKSKDAPVFVSSSEARQVTSTSPVVAPTPTGIQVGDLLVSILVFASNATGGSANPVFPSGWTIAYDRGPSTLVPRVAIGYLKVTSGNIGSLSFSFSNGGFSSVKRVHVLCYRKASGLGAFGATYGQGNFPAPSIALAGNKGKLISTYAANNAVSVTTPPAGMTLVEDSASSTGLPVAYTYEQETSPGASGTRSITWSSSPTYGAINFEILPE